MQVALFAAAAAALLLVEKLLPEKCTHKKSLLFLREGEVEVLALAPLLLCDCCQSNPPTPLPVGLIWYLWDPELHQLRPNYVVKRTLRKEENLHLFFSYSLPDSRRSIWVGTKKCRKGGKGFIAFNLQKHTHSRLQLTLIYLSAPLLSFFSRASFEPNFRDDNSGCSNWILPKISFNQVDGYSYFFVTFYKLSLRNLNLHFQFYEQ